MALDDMNLEEGNVSESVSDVSEADLQRARDNAKKAKKVGQQIKQVQIKNKKFAEMLSLLLRLILDDVLLGHIFHQLVKDKVAVPAIFAQFLPYLKTRIDIEIYKNMYEVLWAQLPKEENIVHLVGWLRLVKNSSGTLQAIEENRYLLFVLSYLDRYGLIDLKSLDKEKKKELEEEIKKEMKTI